jgi:hypothetical protein
MAVVWPHEGGDVGSGEAGVSSAGRMILPAEVVSGL